MSGRKPFLRNMFENYFKLDEDDTSPEHYKVLKKNIIAVMFLITVVPHSIMIGIDYYQLGEKHKGDIENAMHILADKTKYSVEMYLEKKLSIVRLITNVYSLEDLENKSKMNKLLWVLKKEFKSFVDIGLINPQGEMVCYAGPFATHETDYSKDENYQKTLIREGYISNIFSGTGSNKSILEPTVGTFNLTFGLGRQGIGYFHAAIM